MKTLNINFSLVITALIIASCGGDPKNNSSKDSTDNSIDNSFEEAVAEQDKKRAEAEKTTKMLCDQFPKELILTHNPDADRVEIESTELIPGKLDHCKIKLYFGDEATNFREGRVSAWAPNMPNPLGQYKPYGGLYHKIDEFGKKGVFISTTNQLLIIQDGLIYDLVPPSNGRMTSTGKENKEIVLEMARHYNL